MDRILKKFCAKPVQILLTRIRERPEDFVNESNYTVWQRLVNQSKHYTWVERKAIDYAMRKMKKTYLRKKLLDRILEATIDPSKNHEDMFYGPKPGALFQPNLLAEYQRIYTETMRRTLDSEALISPNIVRFDSNGKVLTTPCK